MSVYGIEPPIAITRQNSNTEITPATKTTKEEETTTIPEVNSRLISFHGNASLQSAKS